MTMRYFNLKELRADTVLCDGYDWREPGLLYTAQLGQESHCRSFHELYDHDYGKDMKRLSLRDCLRIGSIWVIIDVEHQSDLDLDRGVWLSMADYKDQQTRNNQ